MNNLIRIILWNPLKKILNVVSKELFYSFKINLLNFLSLFGYTNSLNRMDKEIIKFFDYKKFGICMEVGAADGIDQSNSLLLERLYDWKTFLVEPVKSQYDICKNYRKKSNVSSFAFVSKDTYENNKTIEINANNLQSSIVKNIQPDSNNVLKVPTKTLDIYLEEKNISSIDIFILDVEGYEIEVLKGYTNSSIIKYMLIEAWDFEKFKGYADTRNWKYIKKIGKDYLFDLNPNESSSTKTKIIK